MKHIIVMMLTAIFCCRQQNDLLAQDVPKSIAPYPITISYDKTSNLIFPSSIKSVDRGSSAVLAQKAPGVENILQIKAGEQNFKETNLTVVTADGHFYSFKASYQNEPTTLNFSFVKDSSEKAIIKDQPVSGVSFSNIAGFIRSKKPALYKSIRQAGIRLSLQNIFIQNEMVYVEIGVQNNWLIPFTPAYERFFLRDRKTAKRTASQEIELDPLYHTPIEKVEKGKAQSYVFAFAAFTLPSNKEWVIQIEDASGGGSLSLILNHRIFQKARQI